MKITFSELGLAEPFFRAAASSGYTEPTPIQTKAIPAILSGRDLVGCAQTGTGKTAAFTLPMLDRLLQTLPPKGSRRHSEPSRRRPRRNGPGLFARPLRGLVLSPTRELAAQINDSLAKYGKHSPLRQTAVYGGVSQGRQVNALQQGVDVLVATPGRLIDLTGQGHVDFSKVEILVLDEADQMLDMGFLPALKQIVGWLPDERQTLMFSATMPMGIRRLTTQWLNDPISIEVAPAATPAERIQQSVHMVNQNQKADLLTRFLQETPQARTLVFSRTKHGADRIVRRLQRDGLRAAAIHGNKSQNARTRALEQFKGSNPPVLVATDIASRGLDIRAVSHIVNYDLPATPEVYVHRIGRTARAGAAGKAVSFCAGGERQLLKQIEKLLKCRIPLEPQVAGLEPAAAAAAPTADKQHGGKRRRFQQAGRRQKRGRGKRVSA